jgi:hypothetical protein
MTSQTTTSHTTGPEEPTNPWAMGAILFAAVMMMLAGAFHIIAGLTGLFENEFYVTTPNYIAEFDATTWGWIHILLGAVVALAGVGVLRGNLAARILAIAIAALSAIANFLFIPYYPFWSFAIIAIDVFVIWALAAHGNEMAD